MVAILIMYQQSALIQVYHEVVADSFYQTELYLTMMRCIMYRQVILQADLSLEIIQVAFFVYWSKTVLEWMTVFLIAECMS